MSNLDKEINNLKQLTMKMGELVIENLKVALEIYYNYDKEKADLINDDVVDLHERLIEEMHKDKKTYCENVFMITNNEKEKII